MLAQREVTCEVIPRDNPFQIEAEQENCISYDVDPLCAQCLKDAGLPMGEGSHGLCQPHADEFLLQYKEWKVRQGNGN